MLAQTTQPLITGLDPLAVRIIVGAAVLVVVALLLRIIGRRREAVAAARARAELREGMQEVRLKLEEIHRLAERIITTSSTSHIAGYVIVRQVEAVFSDGCKSSALAVDMVKALAAQKGANGIVHLQSQQAPGGKWVASGDAVLIKALGRRGEGGGITQ